MRLSAIAGGGRRRKIGKGRTKIDAQRGQGTAAGNDVIYSSRPTTRFIDVQQRAKQPIFVLEQATHLSEETALDVEMAAMTFTVGTGGCIHACHQWLAPLL